MMQTFKGIFSITPYVNIPKSFFTVTFTLFLPFIIYGQISTAYSIKKWRRVQNTAVWFFCLQRHSPVTFLIAIARSVVI